MAVGTALLIKVAHAVLKVTDSYGIGDAAIGGILGFGIKGARIKTLLAESA